MVEYALLTAHHLGGLIGGSAAELVERLTWEHVVIAFLVLLSIRMDFGAFRGSRW
jgi:hypothetical protein